MNPDRLLIYGAAFTIMGLSNAIIPILPELANQSNTPGEFISSLLFSAYFLGALSTMLPFGILADKYGTIKFLSLGIILTAVVGLIILSLENIWVLLISRFIEGLACGAFFPAAFAALSEFKNPGRYIGEFTFLFNAGLASGALLSGLLADRYLKGAIFVFTLMSLILTFYLFLRYREFILPHKKQKPGQFSIFPEILIRAPFKEIIRLFNQNDLRIWISSFLLNGAIGILIAYYPNYSIGVLSKAQLGGAIASLYVCAMITSLFAGRFDIKEDTLIKIGIVFSAFGALSAIKYPFLGFSSLGGGSGIATVGFAVVAARINADRGLVMGFLNTTIYAGLSFVPVIAGLFTGILSFEELFIANSLILAGALLLKNKENRKDVSPEAFA